MNKSIYVITGSLGFVGFNLSKYLIDSGHRVIGIDIDNNSDPLREWRYKESERIGVKTLIVDISDKYQVESVSNELNKISHIESIFHLAGLAGVRKSIENPDKYYNVNLRGTFNMLQLFKSIEANSLVFSSTSSVYGDISAEYFSKESDSLNTISPYASSKLSAEKLCQLFSNLYELNISVLRYFTVYGVAGRPDMSILKFINLIYKDKPITIYGDGSQERDFTYVSDICRGTYASSKLKGFNLINLGKSNPEKLISAVRIIEDKLGKKAKIIFKPQNKMDVNRTSADIANSKKLINWDPLEDLESGLSKTIDWYKENTKSLEKLS
ncbi:MAG: SDR family NAD(P)-dependent oxidoreductase [Chloroflexota bacterium]|nr:SDR family NAD(P)-dependent oxidoreductase [Chloroflexota bacterium]